MHLSFPGPVQPAVFKAKTTCRRASRTGETRDSHVRIVLVGAPGSGKTSLLRSLLRETFNVHEASTQGVDIVTPLVKGESMAGRAHQPDKSISIFDHRGAQLEAQQLVVPSEEPAKSPTPPSVSDLAKEYCSSKVSGSDNLFAIKKEPSSSHDVSSGKRNSIDALADQLEGNANTVYQSVKRL